MPRVVVGEQHQRGVECLRRSASVAAAGGELPPQPGGDRCPGVVRATVGQGVDQRRDQRATDERNGLGTPVVV